MQWQCANFLLWMEWVLGAHFDASGVVILRMLNSQHPLSPLSPLSPSRWRYRWMNKFGSGQSRPVLCSTIILVLRKSKPHHDVCQWWYSHARRHHVRTLASTTPMLWSTRSHGQAVKTSKTSCRCKIWPQPSGV